MTGLILAWMVGEGIMTYRVVTQNHRPPLPAEILGTSGLFALLALLGEAQPQLAALLAWGFDLAAFMAVASKIGQGKKTTTTTTKATPKASPAH